MSWGCEGSVCLCVQGTACKMQFGVAEESQRGKRVGVQPNPWS